MHMHNARSRFKGTFYYQVIIFMSNFVLQETWEVAVEMVA